MTWLLPLTVITVALFAWWHMLARAEAQVRRARDWILKRRDEGLSWRLVARALYERTGGQIDVTYETLRAWSEQQAA